MTLVGYSRVSTSDQTTDLQDDALRAAGCERIFTDQASGVLTSRPELDAAMDYVRPGDVLCVWRLDRLGRSLSHLLTLVKDLEERGVGFRSLQEGLDTTTASGRMLFAVVGALSEYERAMIVERTRAGLAAAKARGRTGGRPKVMTDAKTRAAKAMHAEGTNPTEIARALGCSRATIYRALRPVEVGT